MPLQEVAEDDGCATMMRKFEAARRDRLQELGVSERGCTESMKLPLDPATSEDNHLRIMQFNVLADGLSDDGFMAMPVIDDWPADPGFMPTSNGTAVPFDQVFEEIAAAKGDESKLLELKSKFTTRAATENAKALTDWRGRELQIVLMVLASGVPDILVFEEVDKFQGLAAALAQIGYRSQVPWASGEYVPAHVEKHSLESDERRTAFRDFCRSRGHTFLPNLGSTAKKLALKRQAQVTEKSAADLLDDDGVAIFWRGDRVEATLMDVHFLQPQSEAAPPKKAVLQVNFRVITSGREVLVFGAHLSSGGKPEDEAKRLKDEVDSPGGLVSILRSARNEAASKEAAVLLCMDANSHPQLRSPDEASSVWRSIHKVLGASVWDEFFDEDGTERPVDPSGLQAPITTNKFRGPASDQPRKIGEHAHECIDHIFFDPSVLTLRRHVLPPERFRSSTEALQDLQPSLKNPSDHYPVVVDLAWRES